MVVSHNVPVSAETVNALVQRILPLLNGQRKTDCEVALIAAYCCVADGVGSYDPATRQARANIVVARGARSLCEIIEQVGAMPDADVRLETAVAGTCQN